MTNVFCDHNTECVLLASVLEFPEVYHQAVALGLRADHFDHVHHRAAWRTMLALGEGGEPVAYERVLAEVHKFPGADDLVAVLADLTDPLHVPRKDVAWHVAQIKAKWQRRQLKNACERSAQVVEDASQETAECFSALAESLQCIAADSIARDAVRLRQVLPATLKGLETRANLSGLAGYSTDIPELDDSTTGICPGELWIAGGLSGRGKTCLGTQVALKNASAGHPVLFFSLEMTSDELSRRFLAAESAVSAGRIRNPKYISREQWRALLDCSTRLESWPLFIDDSPSLTIQELVSRARLYIRRHGCRLVIVDYLRLVNAPGKELRERLANVGNGLRELAKTENVAVLALSQLRRPEGGINARPSMLELKESGDLEAHAHVVLLLYMPFSDDLPTGRDEIVIGKNRHGPVGAIDVHFDRERLKFFPRRGEESDEDDRQGTLAGVTEQ